MKYSEYLKSDHWNKLKNRLSRLKRPVCEICGSLERLQVHHVTYSCGLFNIEPVHLRKVCDVCHEVIHNLLKSGKLVYRSKRVHARWKQTVLAVCVERRIIQPANARNPWKSNV